MKIIKCLYFVLCPLMLIGIMPTYAADRYVGGDISLLPEYEEAGAQYKTHDGTPVSELLPWLYEQGMNAMRVRLFVDPDHYKGQGADANACQSLEYILPLCQRLKQQGFALMLDFHYSDTWADPGAQWTPADWAKLDDTALAQTLYEYTRDVLLTLTEAGAQPDFIQPGNEISYGMLWGPVGTPDKELKKTFMGSDTNWHRLGDLLSHAIKACREVCPDAGIVLHTERVATPDVQRNFYDWMQRLGIDYDIIGLSYYPYFHGPLSSLKRAIEDLEQNFTDKQIMVVETGYSYKWEVPGTNQKVDYAYSDEGQNQFARDLVNMLREHTSVTGLFWWWLEYNAYGTSLSGWYNAPLFDSTTGHACSALTTICSFADKDNGVELINTDSNDNQWFDLMGRPVTHPSLPGLYINRRGKILIP
ncbi:MAG: arabinogalactan endo-1,4-beta-galactosidase [Muribaculaceae bacterium]|nr:arabinogalactan endo-1,4-beta-galactosidase [Muribaculaceae bacterium]